MTAGFQLHEPYVSLEPPTCLFLLSLHGDHPMAVSQPLPGPAFCVCDLCSHREPLTEKCSRLDALM